MGNHISRDRDVRPTVKVLSPMLERELGGKDIELLVLFDKRGRVHLMRSPNAMSSSARSPIKTMYSPQIASVRIVTEKGLHCRITKIQGVRRDPDPVCWIAPGVDSDGTKSELHPSIKDQYYIRANSSVKVLPSMAEQELSEIGIKDIHHLLIIDKEGTIRISSPKDVIVNKVAFPITVTKILEIMSLSNRNFMLLRDEIKCDEPCYWLTGSGGMPQCVCDAGGEEEY